MHHPIWHPACKRTSTMYVNICHQNHGKTWPKINGYHPLTGCGAGLRTNISSDLGTGKVLRLSIDGFNPSQNTRQVGNPPQVGANKKHETC